MPVNLGNYVHFDGRKYEAIDRATHSETLEEMVIFRERKVDGALWVCPSAIWGEEVAYGGRMLKRK